MLEKQLEDEEEEEDELEEVGEGIGCNVILCEGCLMYFLADGGGRKSSIVC